MASKSYYEADERTRRSVMAAQGTGGSRSISEIHNSTRGRFSQAFDQSAFLATIGNVQMVIEGICLDGTNGWDEVQRLQPDILRRSSRLLQGDSVRPVLSGHDRAVCSTFF